MFLEKNVCPKTVKVFPGILLFVLSLYQFYFRHRGRNLNWSPHLHSSPSVLHQNASDGKNIRSSVAWINDATSQWCRTSFEAFTLWNYSVTETCSARTITSDKSEETLEVSPQRVYFGWGCHYFWYRCHFYFDVLQRCWYQWARWVLVTMHQKYQLVKSFAAAIKKKLWTLVWSY